MTYPLKEEIVKEVKSQLEPLFMNFYKTSPSYKAFMKAAPRIEKRGFRNASIFEVLTQWSKSESSSNCPKKFFLINEALSYLLMVEVGASFYVDIACLLLIGNGKTLHLNPDSNHHYIRHAKNMKDVESPYLPLSIKLDFLEENGLPLFKKWINTNIRNKIAHGNFEVDDDCNFFIINSKGNKSKVDLQTIKLEFSDYALPVIQVFSEKLFKNK